VAAHRLLNVDLEKLAREAQSAVERLARLNRANHALYRELEPLVGSFCPGLAPSRFTFIATEPARRNARVTRC